MQQLELARISGVPQATISALETRDSVRSEYAPQLAKALGVSIEELVGAGIIARAMAGASGVEPGPRLRGRIPVISWVQAGSFASVVDNLHPGEAEEWADTTVAVRRHTYALRVRGDSMTNPEGEPTFQDGQIIVVEPDAIDSPDRLVGKFVVVKRARDNEATFKQLTKDAGVYYLKPLNPRYKLIELQADDTICGVVVQKVVNY